MIRYRETAWNTGEVVTVTVTDLETGAKRISRFPAHEDLPEHRESVARALRARLEDPLLEGRRNAT
jgi:hypothetical protein